MAWSRGCLLWPFYGGEWEGYRNPAADVLCPVFLFVMKLRFRFAFQPAPDQDFFLEFPGNIRSGTGSCLIAGESVLLEVSVFPAGSDMLRLCLGCAFSRICLMMRKGVSGVKDFSGR